ncbi:MAG: acyltransferase [Planctomicrobium sp.]|jgi:peptidoglycan/LPS O-acetylase OafA/YrhL|nr:acyltransferase [Planctomicrobium sp.]
MHYFLLDLLRGLAALWVFAFHFHFSEKFIATFPHLHILLKQGDLGVPMFFVISGYCITASARSTIRREEKTSRFLYRRLRRIYPPFWISIIIVASVPFLTELISSVKTGSYTPPTSLGNNLGYLNYTVFEWIRLTTLTQVFWPVENANSLQAKFTTINAVYWTLAIEVQFYLVVALSLSLSRRFLYSLLLVVTVSCLILSSLGISAKTGLFIPYWQMFAIGVLLCFAMEKGWSLGGSKLQSTKFIRTLSPLILIIGVVTFIVRCLNGYEPSWILFSVFFASSLWLVKPYDETLKKLSENRYLKSLFTPLICLGAISYTLYLLHDRLQFLTAQLVRQVFEINSIIYDMSVTLVTCILCWPIYLLFEAPFVKSKSSNERNSTLSQEASCSDEIYPEAPSKS